MLSPHPHFELGFMRSALHITDISYLLFSSTSIIFVPKWWELGLALGNASSAENIYLIAEITIENEDHRLQVARIECVLHLHQ